jgi:hypothetical protein
VSLARKPAKGGTITQSEKYRSKNIVTGFTFVGLAANRVIGILEMKAVLGYIIKPIIPMIQYSSIPNNRVDIDSFLGPCIRHLFLQNGEKFCMSCVCFFVDTQHIV